MNHAGFLLVYPLTQSFAVNPVHDQYAYIPVHPHKLIAMYASACVHPTVLDPVVYCMHCKACCTIFGAKSGQVFDGSDQKGHFTRATCQGTPETPRNTTPRWSCSFGPSPAGSFHWDFGLTNFGWTESDSIRLSPSWSCGAKRT